MAGVYSADPRKVKDACLLPLLRLDEASELARLAAPGAARAHATAGFGSDIDLQLRCSYTPDQGSTPMNACWHPVRARALSPAMMTSA